MNNLKKRDRRSTACNERFGASGGVTPQKVSCVNESLSPAITAVSPPPSPSRRTLSASGGQCGGTMKHENKRVAMKKTVIILSVLAVITSGYGQSNTKNNVETQSKNSKNLVRSDETILEEIFGDLNNDGEDDCVIITKQTKKEAMSVKNQFDEEVDRNRRGIVIAFKEGEYYNTILAIPDCFSSENEDGGVYFAPELSVEILKGNLKIHYGHGRYGWWQYLFRYRNNNFELIGYDGFSHRGPIMQNGVSINFLTKKQQTLTNTNLDAEDESEEVIEETWQNITISNLVKLIDIKDFDEFSVSDYYTEK
jgi:hypothetical protein